MKISKTWWGEEFLKALTEFMEEGRITRGRAYSGSKRLLKYDIKDSVIQAKVRGNINHYFGVYKEPRYKITIKLKQFSKTNWENILENIVQNAGWISKLMLYEIPEDIEEVFTDFGLSLLPQNNDDLDMNCSCPDYYYPCKHIGGIYFKTATLIDADPFLLFKLRGMNQDDLQKSLAKTTLGKMLLEKTNIITDNNIEKISNLYTKVESKKFIGNVNLNKFWYGILTDSIIDEQSAYIPGVVLKKSTDCPLFWNKNKSFINTMNNIYTAVKRKNRVKIPKKQSS